MTRLFINAALFCLRMGDKQNAIACTRLALRHANQEGLRGCAGHLLCALNLVR